MEVLGTRNDNLVVIVMFLVNVNRPCSKQPELELRRYGDSSHLVDSERSYC